MRYFGRKLIHLIPVVFAVTTLSFLLLNLLPGDVVDAMLSASEDGDVDPATLAAMRNEFGLDRPMVVRYFEWVFNALQGDLGRSYLTRQHVSDAILRALPVTLQLMVMGQIIAVLLAIPTGILCAFRAGKPIDRMLTATVFGLLAAPSFIIGIVLMFVFAVTLKWFPAVGYVPMGTDLWANLHTFALPAFTIGLAEWPALMRVLRSDMIATLQNDFIMLAKAKGLSTAHILFRHALRPSSFTLVTVLGLQLGLLIAGSIVVESIFALPGIGRLLIVSITTRDLLMVQGVVAFIGFSYVMINFAVDMMYAALDPRIRFG